MIRSIFAAALLGGTLLAPTAHAAQPGDRRTGTLEVTVTYSGQGSWKKGREQGSHVVNRKLSYRVPLVGHVGAASGFAEWDKNLEPKLSGPIPQPKASRADLAAIVAAAEAAEASCDEDDEVCIARVINGDGRAVQAASRIDLPGSTPQVTNTVDFTRYIAFGPDCSGTVATATIADKHEEMRLEGSEGGAGLNHRSYTVGGTETKRGSDTGQACRVSAAVDTKGSRYALSLPVEATVLAKPSNAPGAAYTHQLSGTNGSTKLPSRTRWLDLPMAAGAKSLTGRRVLENINDAGANGTAIRATIDWKITLN